jgi:ATP-binding cassette subfamily B (MDR/TAP) protein 8
MGHFLREISRNCQQQTAKCSAIINEIISNIQTIKSCAMEEKEIELYKEEIKKLSELNQSLGNGISLFQGASNIGLNGIVLCTLVFGGYLMSNNEIKPGQLMASLMACQTIQRSLASLSLMTGHYVKYTVTANRIFDYINMQPQLSSSGYVKLDPLIGEISFRKVDFSYPTRKKQNVFNNFNLKINPGETFAIVGLYSLSLSFLNLSTYSHRSFRRRKINNC